MKRWKVLNFKLVTLFTGILAFVILINFNLAPEKAKAVPKAETAAAWTLLQRGEPGLVVMVRHAIAPGVGDPANFKLGDCSTQRNLSPEGRKQAVRLGEAFRSRNIQVARVLSSQWCRCLETAKLMNLGTVEPLTALNSFIRDYSNQSKQTVEVRQFIVNNRNTKGAIVMVTHQVNITAVTGIVPVSGESVVLQGNQKGKVEVVGRIGTL